MKKADLEKTTTELFKPYLSSVLLLVPSREPNESPSPPQSAGPLLPADEISFSWRSGVKNPLVTENWYVYLTWLFEKDGISFNLFGVGRPQVFVWNDYQACWWGSQELRALKNMLKQRKDLSLPKVGHPFRGPKKSSLAEPKSIRAAPVRIRILVGSSDPSESGKWPAMQTSLVSTLCSEESGCFGCSSHILTGWR